MRAISHCRPPIEGDHLIRLNAISTVFSLLIFFSISRAKSIINLASRETAGHINRHLRIMKTGGTRLWQLLLPFAIRFLLLFGCINALIRLYLLHTHANLDTHSDLLNGTKAAPQFSATFAVTCDAYYCCILLLLLLLQFHKVAKWFMVSTRSRMAFGMHISGWPH